MNRRQALQGLAKFLLASPVLRGAELTEGLIQGPSLPQEDPMAELINVFDFAKLAQTRLDPLAWDYMAEGGKDQVTLGRNREAFDELIIRPRMLRDVHKIDLSTTFLGRKLDYPIFICPSGGKNCFYPNGEEEVAKAAAESNALMITNGEIDDYLNSGHAPENWWQFTSGQQFVSRNAMLNFVEKLEDMGAAGVSFTVDIPYVSHRETSIRNKFARRWCDDPAGVLRDAQGRLVYKEGQPPWEVGGYPERAVSTPTWDTVRRLQDVTELPILIKGILTAEDTEKCVEYGAAGVVVSNHGARQLDHTGSPIEVLEECVQAARGRIPVLVDGGFRRGTDILKALALGATAVGVARPYLWGMSCFGQRGVSRILELLRVELALDMSLSGVARISDIERSLVRKREWGD